MVRPKHGALLLVVKQSLTAEPLQLAVPLVDTLVLAHVLALRLAYGTT